MASIIIHTSNQKDLSLLKELANRMGFKAQVLTDSNKEDLVLAKAIKENDPENQLTLEEAKLFYQSLDKSR